MPGPLVCAGASIQCSAGGSGTLNVLPENKTMGTSGPVATIMDNKPGVNLALSGSCAIMLGLPCAPAFSAPWTPGSPTVMVGPGPALNPTSVCICAIGGSVQITFPGPPKSNVP